MKTAGSFVNVNAWIDICANLIALPLSLNPIAIAKSLQSCPTLRDPIDGSPPGSAVPGILQARTLEWAAISFSNAWKRTVKVKSLSCVPLLPTPWTAAYQAPPSMDFPGKSTGVGCHCLLQSLDSSIGYLLNWWSCNLNWKGYSSINLVSSLFYCSSPMLSPGSILECISWCSSQLHWSL